MSIAKTEIRRGAYYDSIVLMQLQAGLAALPGVIEVGVMMGTRANKDLMAESGLLTDEAASARADDLILVVRGEDGAAAAAALARVDELLTARAEASVDEEYRPKRLDTAVKMLPAARWVVVSVPGRYAAGVARDALRLGKHVFLYSDNVPVAEEVALKRLAAERGLLVMGPDCGTALVDGVGLGFANRVRAGSIGLVGASGTGLQHVTARIHQLGGGVSHALGTGGRDLSGEVGAITARQALDVLGRDPATRVIVLLSKPPAPRVADDVLRVARATGKPVVVDFIGYTPPARADAEAAGLYFARTLDETAERAVKLAAAQPVAEGAAPLAVAKPAPLAVAPDLAGNRPAGQEFGPGQRYLRGLFSGGTLAHEALLLLGEHLPVVHSNAPLDPRHKLDNPLVSRGHTIVDLGADELTVGRLHPMMDSALRVQRLAREARDPEVAVLLLDVVLGHGAHPDPAGDLAPAIAAAVAAARDAGRHLEVVAVVVGTDEDPQDMAAQIERLEAAGARVETQNDAAIHRVGAMLASLGKPGELPRVDLRGLARPVAAINVGVEAFAASLAAQDVAAVHVDWRPPAGGDERLMGILARMKARRST